MGSGIYPGYKDGEPVYSFDPNSGDTLLISTVTTVASHDGTYTPNKNHESYPKHQKIPLKRDGNPTLNRRIHMMLHEDFTNYASVLLEKNTEGKEVKTSVCYNKDEFCCSITYKSDTTLNYKYNLNIIIENK